MNKKYLIPVFVLILILVLGSVFALDKLTSYVNDEANVISPEYEQRIYNELEELDKNTSIEVAVATVTSLNGVPIEEYSLNLAHNTLGEKGKDNGLLILLAVEDREYRIEVGYGLEPLITDSRAGRVGRDIMAPYFKAGNYEEGLLQGVITIKKILTNQTEFTNDSSNKYENTAIIVFIVLMIVFFAVIIAVSLIKNQKVQTDKDFKAVENAGLLFGPGIFGGVGRGGFGGSGGFGGFGGGGFGGGGASGGF